MSRDVKLVFTDVVMPDMNGRALADEIAKRWPDLKVVFTTGYTRDAIVHNGILDPGVQLIAKPFKLDELAAKIAAVLDDGPIKSAGGAGRRRESG
jgi:CheY-like chemotaxis protein